MGYLSNFIVYTLAMVGVIVIALMVFKSATGCSTRGATKYLKIHDTLSLGPRKTLYIVSAGEEKFLIASDVDKTSLISKLNPKNHNEENILPAKEDSFTIKDFKETMGKNSELKKYTDRMSIGIHSTNTKPYSSVMKNLAERIKS